MSFVVRKRITILTFTFQVIFTYVCAMNLSFIFVVIVVVVDIPSYFDRWEPLISYTTQRKGIWLIRCQLNNHTIDSIFDLSFFFRICMSISLVDYILVHTRPLSKEWVIVTKSISNEANIRSIWVKLDDVTLRSLCVQTLSRLRVNIKKQLELYLSH